MTTVALVMCPHCIEPTDNIHDLPLTVLDVLASKCFRSATHPGSDFRITAVADRFAETLGAGLLHKAQKEPALWVTRRKVGGLSPLAPCLVYGQYVYGLVQPYVQDFLRPRPHHEWINSGKFQGDIDGIDADLFRQPEGFVFFNALKNKQLTWKDGIIPYVMDPAFSHHEVKLLEKAFASYHKNTCIRFQPRNDEEDYLNIVKGFGCYSQVGRTGGKQEISLGRGCLFHEIIVHELMHSVGFWHEHSRADRDEHIHIRWDNILPGMRSQFDKISASLQDTQGEKYDYRSIMHYDSTAFSRNGRNTIEPVQEGFTEVIGSATDLSHLDIVKINKLYQCASKRKEKPKSSLENAQSVLTSKEKCQDHFVDCPHFSQYCQRASFFFVMKSYCPLTCGHCKLLES
ncbi:hypothetical protein RB195_002208 [Necator americanus]|uniref:Metalloendopeptidase n=1 Tax=Necator americanus TaxID=51031 RepID=A0ABR1DIP2_NECAM